jgi:hypothetical protein
VLLPAELGADELDPPPPPPPAVNVTDDPNGTKLAGIATLEFPPTVPAAAAVVEPGPEAPTPTTIVPVEPLAFKGKSRT